MTWTFTCWFFRYHIGLRYTGGARMLLLLKLKAGVLPITIPVGVRGLDVEGELWVKLHLVPSQPWVGAAIWAFVSLPKIKLDLSPFRLFNLMGKDFSHILLACPPFLPSLSMNALMLFVCRHMFHLLHHFLLT